MSIRDLLTSDGDGYGLAVLLVGNENLFTAKAGFRAGVTITFLIC